MKAGAERARHEAGMEELEMRQATGSNTCHEWSSHYFHQFGYTCISREGWGRESASRGRHGGT